ncbi:transcriptional regulator YqjI [Abditibacteriota bacterium]|nr:transcriptional regulator YqjI [Abditibacteriota bacterium]
MFYDKGNDDGGPEGRHRHGGHGHGRHGRRGLHSGRKLSSSELQLLLLLVLAKQPSHGYELIKFLEERTDGFYVPSPGMVYPALTYLEEIGLALVQAEGTKKLYQLTSEGQVHLQQNQEAAEGILADLERVGAQMANARKAFAEGADDGESTEELEAARRGLRRAEREKAPYTPDEAKRIAGILERATADIIGDAPFQPATNLGDSPIYDPAIRRVLTRLLSAKPRPPRKRANAGESNGLDPHALKNFSFSIRPEQGELIYLLCRSMGAQRVAEFATSLGFSAIYLAAAVRDNGGGLVIGSELVPEKVKAARRNLADAGLDELAEIREGDALETLRDLGGPIDFFLMDGWPTDDEVSLARRVMELVAPQLRVGAMVLNDNSEPDYLEYVRDPANGFRTMSLPFKRTFELSVKVN